MPRPVSPTVWIAAIVWGLIFAAYGRADETPSSGVVPREAVRRTVERALVFMKDDAAKWRADRECATCHHGVFTVWTMAEAKRQGFSVDADAFAENLKWTRTKLDRIDEPRDTRAGWSMMNTPVAYLALMARDIPADDIVTTDELQRINGHFLRHQENDGSWAWSSAPAKNRPPPYFESDEVATLLVLLALAEPTADDPQTATTIRDSRGKARLWLAQSQPNDTTQSAAFRLWLKSRSEVADALLPNEIDRFLALQNPDGGWSQLAGRPSDAYATGQALYVLNSIGVPRSRAEIQRGVTFLVSSQRDDGSWPMTRRGHEGVTPSDFIVPITYFGSAWATLGLLRSEPR